MEKVLCVLLIALVLMEAAGIVLLLKSRLKPDRALEERLIALDSKLSMSTETNGNALKDVASKMTDLTDKTYRQMTGIQAMLSENADKQNAAVTAAVKSLGDSNSAALGNLSLGMQTLTDKTYRQMTDIQKTLSETSDRQSGALTSAVKAMQDTNNTALKDITSKMQTLTEKNHIQMENMQNALSVSTDRQNKSVTGAIREMQEKSEASLSGIAEKMQELTNRNYGQMIGIQKTLSSNSDKQTETIRNAIHEMQTSNERRLDEMRATVDEKLQSTLNERLSSSFKTVSDKLSTLDKSLGEMKELSSGVTDSVKGLNKVLTNVKTRGTWAEVQLEGILDETVPGRYDKNVRTNPDYNGRVEFALRIPNKGDDKDIMYLPIDSKFPMEDYARLSDAAERADTVTMESARRALEVRIKEEAKSIKNYLAPPATTDIAIMYLATEGLYAEVASSKSALLETLQKDRIVVAGPSTITALLNSFAMGFATLSINRKADEVRKTLGTARDQYSKFGDLLAKAKAKINEAGDYLDRAGNKNNQIQRALKGYGAIESDMQPALIAVGE